MFVTTDGRSIVAIDVTKGEQAWKAALEGGANVKKLFGVPGGVVVSDDTDSIRRLDAATGHELWRTPLGSAGTLGFDGEAAEGDLVVATVKPKEGAAIAVALDAATGVERWRRTLPLTDDNAYPHPRILATVVSYEASERVETGGARSRVMLLDRADGRTVQEIEHPTIGRSYQTVIYGPDWIAVNSTNELALYGRAAQGK
jgi:outer membrane protein assembly factor BamB